MAGSPRLICESSQLRDGGSGVRFDVEHGGTHQAAFAVRFGGRVYAYLNRCAHVGTELDWMPGEFFDDSELYLICSTHGAVYDPETGRCLGGPCKGAFLAPVRVEESDGSIFLMEQAQNG
jgi:nitrite reductase/ring-hydroxylating ferredoxin subunit